LKEGLRLSSVLQSLEPNAMMDRVVVKIYLEYLKQFHGVNQDDMIVKGVEETDEFEYSP